MIIIIIRFRLEYFFVTDDIIMLSTADFETLLGYNNNYSSKNNYANH